MNYITRRLKPNESKLYRAIRLEALKEYPEYFGSKYEEQVKLSKLYFERIIEESSPKGIMVGAFLDRELIGICGVTFETKILHNAGEIIQMYVNKKHQGNKLGKELIKSIYDNVILLKNVEIIVLGVDKNNTSAIRTYCNCGFEIDTNIEGEEGIQYMTLLV